MCVFVIISAIFDAKTKDLHTFHILIAKICVKNIRNKKIFLKILKAQQAFSKKNIAVCQKSSEIRSF